jgi:hypothetical protein
MQNLIASWWHFWTKCDNELLMILAIDSNLTIGVCTYTYLSFKKFQHEDSGAFIFWLMFLAFSYWYFGFGVYYDDFKEKGTLFAFNHLKVNLSHTYLSISQKLIPLHNHSELSCYHYLFDYFYILTSGLSTVHNTGFNIWATYIIYRKK